MSDLFERFVLLMLSLALLAGGAFYSLPRRWRKNWQSPSNEAVTKLGLAGLVILAFGIISGQGSAFEWAFNFGGIAVLAGGVVFAWSLFRQWRHRRGWLDGIEMARIDKMSGLELERVCGDIFRRLGYKVEMTKATGDQGADLLLEGKGRRIVVQTKRQTSKVGNGAVQEAVAAKAFYKADDAFVVTNHFYTPAAIKLAEANRVVLVDRNELAKMLARVTNKESFDTQ